MNIEAWENVINQILGQNVCIKCEVLPPIKYDFSTLRNLLELHHEENCVACFSSAKKRYQICQWTVNSTIACKSSRALFCARVAVRLAAQAVAH